MVSAIGLALISNIASASIDDSSADGREESFKVLVTIAADVKEYGWEEVKIIVAYKSDAYQLCKGEMKDHLQNKSYPIACEGHEFEFPKGQIAVGESFDVCVQGPVRYSDCKTLTMRLQSNQRN